MSGYRGHRRLDVVVASRTPNDGSRISIILGFPRDADGGARVERTVMALPDDPAVRPLIEITWQGLQIDMTPLGAGRIIGIPADQLAVGHHDLDAVLGPDASSLLDKLSTTTSWHVRFDAVDKFLKARLQTAPPRSLSVGAAWRSAAASLGLILVTPAAPADAQRTSTTDQVEPPPPTYLDLQASDAMPRSASSIAGS